MSSIMMKRLIAASILGNVAMLALLLWMRARHEGELRDVAMAAMRGDEIHVELHARSLAALESADPKEAAATADLLRPVVAAGKQNVEARQRLGLGR
jgi:hypothetical protein